MCQAAATRWVDHHGTAAEVAVAGTTRWRRPGWLAPAVDLRRGGLLPDVLAGLTLAALAIPEVLGYARIAGMPVESGLYTMVLPMIVFALLGASRRLVVGADSATAAMLAAGLGALAVPAASPEYVRLAGTTALVVGVLLIVARVVRLGALANFLSRTVLVGFLTGVGVQVAIGQLPEALGLQPVPGQVPEKVVGIVEHLGDATPVAVATAAGVVVIVLVARRISRRIPAALVAVVAAIVVTAVAGLDRLGLLVLGAVPAGLPEPALPSLALDDLRAVLPIALSMLVVILAQSAATSRAYAARHGETPDTDRDVVGLAGANVAAAFTGAFVVNGSPTKTQMVDGAGGRSQLAHLTAAAVTVVVILLLTPFLSMLPLAALAAVVLLIGVELVDVAGMRRIWTLRRGEFVVALLTAVAVVVLGVETGIVVAVAASIADHLRHSYAPRSSVLVKSPEGHWRSLPVAAGARTVDGLVVHRFGSGLYFANASRFAEDVRLLTATGPPVRWYCLDAAAIGDVDYSAGTVLLAVDDALRAAGVRMVVSNLVDPVRGQLDRYGVTARIGETGCFDTSGEVLEAFQRDTA
ncbi:SulP family inorganic anion transporter [Pseudonocardia sp. N23]|uniref:SulP family inorganic anion transporter n=1 Tax=Pseudonocardia sp. N23 TaxID=1987376 RepID=UPI0015583C9C|nr:SulP family inorganic anion transporter [Pseudonocardia sp. N23]